jgi:hypothetical protein
MCYPLQAALLSSAGAPQYRYSERAAEHNPVFGKRKRHRRKNANRL